MVFTWVFGEMPDGRPVHLYELRAGAATVRLMDLGASVQAVCVPGRDGAVADVLPGYDSVAGYLASGACFGATVGPSANRSAGGEVLAGDKYVYLPKNDGDNNIHTDWKRGFHMRVWEAEVLEAANAVRFTCELADGEFGLPGNRVFSATYTLAEGDGGGCELRLEYRCETDAATFVNMTNHSYFNLAGHGSGVVYGQEAQIFAGSYLPQREDNVSRGDVAAVAGTPFDFREAKPIGRDIEANCDQLAVAHGYDHCFCVDGYVEDAAPRPAFVAYDPASGRELRISLTTPGAHFYTGNWFEGDTGKDGVIYQPRQAFAFEPEFYPDNSHHADWPHPVCTPNHPFESTVVWHFSVR